MFPDLDEFFDAPSKTWSVSSKSTARFWDIWSTALLGIDCAPEDDNQTVVAPVSAALRRDGRPVPRREHEVDARAAVRAFCDRQIISNRNATYRRPTLRTTASRSEA